MRSGRDPGRSLLADLRNLADPSIVVELLAPRVGSSAICCNHVVADGSGQLLKILAGGRDEFSVASQVGDYARATELDRIAAAHAAVGGHAPGSRRLYVVRAQIDPASESVLEIPADELHAA